MYPVLFKIGSFTIQTVSIFHSLGIYLGALWIYHYSGKLNLEKEKIFNLILLVIIFSVLGARIFSILFDGSLSWYLSHPLKMFAVWNGGFTFYGGFLFGAVAGVWYIKKHKINFWKLADLFAPALALGLAVGRIGCFMSGDSFGKPSNLPWAVTFTSPYSLAPTGIPLHPTQLYSVVTNAFIFVSLLIWKKKQKFEGELFLIFLILYGMTRFFVEIFRNDPRGVYFSGLLSTSQIISFFVIVISGIAYYKLGRRKYYDELGKYGNNKT